MYSVCQLAKHWWACACLIDRSNLNLGLFHSLINTLQDPPSCRRCGVTLPSLTNDFIRCIGECQQYYCYACSGIPDAEHTIAGSANFWKCSTCGSKRHSESACYACGEDDAAGEMLSCQGSDCAMKVHRRCKMIGPELWSCKRCRVETNSAQPLILNEAEMDALNFWVNSPELWFAETEAYFDLRQIYDDDMKYNYVCTSLEKVSPKIAKTLREKKTETVTKLYDHIKRETLALFSEKKRNSEIKNVKTYCWDRREMLTEGSISELNVGEWNGDSFVVQVIDRPPAFEGLLSRILPFTFIVITDGRDKTTVRISRELLPLIKSPVGLIEDFPVIEVKKCKYKVKPMTKLLEERPS